MGAYPKVVRPQMRHLPDPLVGSAAARQLLDHDPAARAAWRARMTQAQRERRALERQRRKKQAA